MKLSQAQLHWLRWLDAHGGASLDGQVLLGDGQGDARTPVAALVSFLHLIAKGMIEVRRERFYVSEAGRYQLEASKALTDSYANGVRL
jgi:hypothetical protein